jgi:hypothetical protein
MVIKIEFLTQLGFLSIFLLQIEGLKLCGCQPPFVERGCTGAGSPSARSGHRSLARVRRAGSFEQSGMIRQGVLPSEAQRCHDRNASVDQG